MRSIAVLTFAAALLATLLASGCGTEQPSALRDADASLELVPSTSPSASGTPTTQPADEPSPTPSHAADLTGPLADFPLAMGLPGENENDHSPVVVTGEPATHAFSECGHQVWDPREGTTDVIGVDWSAEAEWSRGRTLVRYPSVDAAVTAVDRASAVITSCPRDGGNDSGWTEHTGLDYYTGDQSYGWIDRYWSADVDGFDTGLTVYHEVRVGRTVLFTYEYMEANGSPQSRDKEVARAAREDQSVVDAMGGITTEDAVELTPSGAGPFRLGMSADEATAAGGTVRPHGGATGCAELSWSGPGGATVRGAFSPGRGLGYVSVDGGRTAEGIGLGATVADLRTAYPDLQHADNGLWYVDREPGDLAFATYEGGVNWMVALGDDQTCAG